MDIGNVVLWQNMETPSLARRDDGSVIYLDNAHPSYGGKPMYVAVHARGGQAAFDTFGGACENIERLDSYYMPIPNRLVACGFLGMYRVYLNVTKEEAIRRYRELDGEDPTNVQEVEFTDEFYAYEVGSSIV